MNRYEREKPGTGGARAAVNFHWNTRKSDEERQRYLHAADQNHVWYEVWRALFHDVHSNGVKSFSWAWPNDNLRHRVQMLRQRSESLSADEGTAESSGRPGSVLNRDNP
jgi:hypothetical protein